MKKKKFSPQEIEAHISNLKDRLAELQAALPELERNIFRAKDGVEQILHFDEYVRNKESIEKIDLHIKNSLVLLAVSKLEI
ncbi:MAG: hypothetical protein EBR94_11785 [Bacteroidetes bacterium]|nr:hypothetical protein [Bacteroidota bacterium]